MSTNNMLKLYSAILYLMTRKDLKDYSNVETIRLTFYYIQKLYMAGNGDFVFNLNRIT